MRLKSVEDLLSVTRMVYGGGSFPKPFSLLEAADRVDNGEDPGVSARAAGTTARRISRLRESPDRIVDAFGLSLADAEHEKIFLRAKKGLGQMLLGLLAERAFEEIYKSKMGTSELRLEDARSSRNDTDYRVYNGSGKPVFRINIKFHGTEFRNAQELVGLEPGDCFALATYKIHQGLIKQQEEALPYLFLVVSVLGVSGESVADGLPAEFIHLAALALGSSMSGKRAVEDAIVACLTGSSPPRSVSGEVAKIYPRIRKATWRVMSARRASRILLEKLFERVYALRVRSFARNYKNAELDMHFSLSSDMKTLDGFLGVLRDRGLHGVSVLLERGDL